MSRPEFEVEIDGDGLRPETLDVLDLAHIFVPLRKAICAAAGIVEKRREPLFSLVGVKTGSAKLQVSCSPVAAEGVERIRSSRAGTNPDALSYDMYDTDLHLHALCKFITKRKWRFRLRGGRTADELVISAEHPVNTPVRTGLRGRTTLYGELKRVGGETPAAILTLSGSETKINVKLSEALAQELGHALYKIVGLEGDAIWRPGSTALVEFTATKVISMTPKTPLAAFEVLEQSSGGCWDGVDAEAYVREIRGDEGE